MDLIKQKAGRARRARRSGRFVEPSLPTRAAVLLIRLYQKTISPYLGQRCRFHPSCSNYCIDAMTQHGMVHGLWLGLKRISKCHPFHPGGYDPVPEPGNESVEEKQT